MYTWTSKNKQHVIVIRREKDNYVTVVTHVNMQGSTCAASPSTIHQGLPRHDRVCQHRLDGAAHLPEALHVEVSPVVKVPVLELVHVGEVPDLRVAEVQLLQGIRRLLTHTLTHNRLTYHQEIHRLECYQHPLINRFTDWSAINTHSSRDSQAGVLSTPTHQGIHRLECYPHPLIKRFTGWNIINTHPSWD